MQLVLHPDAQAEVLEAADWYDQRARGLGDDFLSEIDAAFGTLRERPGVWPVWPGAGYLVPPVQRYLLSRFHSYGIAYQRAEVQVLVLAVVHARRRPFYWLQRTSG